MLHLEALLISEETEKKFKVIRGWITAFYKHNAYLKEGKIYLASEKKINI